MDSVSGVGVLDKAMVVLAAVEDRPCTLAELVPATGLSRPTAHRLAVALEAHGLLRRDDDGRFCLGLRFIGLGHSAAESVPVWAAARPALVWLHEQTGESVQLFVRDGEHRVCVDSIESLRELRTIVPVGARLPLAVGSAGRVLSGASNGVSAKGWVQSVGEREEGVASVSAPVHDRSGHVVAAVSVSGPIQRTSRKPGDRYGSLVAEAARQVEEAVAR
ncbi:MAG: IclR family transcriptional regulator [Actinomycetota bacterium]|nr:IclR family transcriptional regulator [Actinomycetota bacterium]